MCFQLHDFVNFFSWLSRYFGTCVSSEGCLCVVEVSVNSWLLVCERGLDLCLQMGQQPECMGPVVTMVNH